MTKSSSQTAAFILVLAVAFALGGLTGDWSIVTAVAVIGLTLRAAGALLTFAWDGTVRA
jgi:uncharacterized membrane protein